KEVIEMAKLREMSSSFFSGGDPKHCPRCDKVFRAELKRCPVCGGDLHTIKSKDVYYQDKEVDQRSM
ncbi:MAG: hypothetical protein LBF80_02345, partial [Spirochaetaceae bacterium]|nr:hypothetical protein [Spirochaetaceae bacterium]